MTNRFVFIACHYNMAASIARMLHSIYGQSYANWKLIITDDVSSVDDRARLKATVNQFRSIQNSGSFINDIDKVIVHYNAEKRWETLNVLNMIRQHCAPEDIVCRIDCDDYLCDLDALAIIHSAYEQTGCDALWTMHRWGLSDRNISGSMSDESDPYVHPWVSSHLKTFRARLLNGVNEENFKGETGEYVRRAGDQALYLPVLKNAAKRFFLPRVVYHYHIDEQGGAVYQTDDARFQRDEALFLRSRGFVE